MSRQLHPAIITRIKPQMYENNLLNLIERQRRVNLITAKRRQVRAPRRILFPELRIQQLNPHLRNPMLLPSLTELLSSGQARQTPPRRLAEVIGSNHFALNSFPTREIVLVAKRMGYMESHSENQQQFREGDRTSKNKTEKKAMIPNKSLAETELEEAYEALQSPDKRTSSSMSNRHNVTPNERPQRPKQPRAPRCYYYSVPNGSNNEQLIKQLLQLRPHWKELKKGVEAVANFKWVSHIDNFSYKKMASYNICKMVNHFQCHHEVTTKNALIRNLQIYCQSRKIELFSLTPITFLVDFDDEYCEYNLKQFLYFFLKNQPKRSDSAPTPTSNGAGQVYKQVNGFLEDFVGYMGWQNSEIKRKSNPLSKPILYPCYTKQESYVWLLKPTGLNRGRGIEIFDSLEGLQRILLTYMQLNGRRKNQNRQKQKERERDDTPHPTYHTTNPNSSNTAIGQAMTHHTSGNISLVASSSNPQQQVQKPSQPFKLKTCSFVLQKYIQNPLLIDDRKFDIRVWVLLKQDMSLYFFKEGYLRMSSQKYSLDLSNYFIHLTNNAVQQHSKQYGNFENGNQLSFDTFRTILKEREAPVTFQTIYERIKELCYISMSSVRAKINPHKRKHCFEVFGYDFILDDSYKVWLIEVNSNPCIEMSSSILRVLMPRMLSDALKLTVDELFPEMGCEQDIETRQTCQSEKQAVFPVQGYPDRQSMWTLLGRLGPNSEYKKPLTVQDVTAN